MTDEQRLATLIESFAKRIALHEGNAVSMEQEKAEHYSTPSSKLPADEQAELDLHIGIAAAKSIAYQDAFRVAVSDLLFPTVNVDSATEQLMARVDEIEQQVLRDQTLHTKLGEEVG